jgi:uncharacterized protein (DUF488 family)
VPTLFTIGFTRSSAESFFTRLRTAGVARLIDVRLNNVSQLAGFAKRDDLAYFLAAILGISYQHETALAPTAELLAAYRESHDWPAYARDFADLLRARQIETLAPIDRACLLCSEHTAGHCHRRIVAEYLAPHWGDARIVHL